MLLTYHFSMRIWRLTNSLIHQARRPVMKGRTGKCFCDVLGNKSSNTKVDELKTDSGVTVTEPEEQGY